MMEDHGEIATSKSQLLAPSASSTNRPSRSNLGSYGASDDSMSQHDSAASFELLLPKKSKRKESALKAKIMRRIRKRPALVAAVLFTFAALIALAISLTVGSRGPLAKKHRLVVDERAPFSTLDPVKDLGLYPLERPEASAPPHSVLRGSEQRALPTNTWYQNLLMAKGEPSDVHRAYPMPYVVDVVGPIPGLRAHPNHLDASTTVVQLSYVDSHGLTLGAAYANGKSPKRLPSKKYSVISTTALAATLEWDALPMSASIVKGMPYTTMHYPKPLSSKDMLPTIVSELKLATAPISDINKEMKCNGKSSRVESELKLSFAGSDFTWLVFFSEPVMVRCVEQPEGIGGAEVIFQITQLAETSKRVNELEQLTVRAALLNNCTYGENQIFCRHKETSSQTEKYATLLRERAHLYPGPQADVQYDIDNNNDTAILKFNWDVQNMKQQRNNTKISTESGLRSKASASDADDEKASSELITYALSHHLHRMSAKFMPWGNDRFCKQSLIGPICVVSGSTWDLVEDLPPIAFQAPRPPIPESISVIAKTLPSDLSYQLDDYYQRGAGDTYFSGKMLARMARVLLIGEEVMNLCDPKRHDLLGYSLTSQQKKDYAAACDSIQFPSQEQMKVAVSTLRSSVEVWINGTAEVPFVYDSAWGGVINCGCQFDEKTSSCSNKFPDCPAVGDPGMNFGNGFYNDHHFHYGYHIYAAATVAHFDRAWGREHFEQVLFLVRDIANPSNDDIHFPKCRQKDWYQGNSWASGVPLPPYPNGKNQESSSEAIASYEAVSLFGQEMMHAWEDAGDKHKIEVASHVYDVGRLLTATEVRAADYYWHVRKHDESMKIYPSVYAQHAVGMLWNTMAQFQTWFGSAPYLAVGIQLLPLTAISERRDKQSWIKELYPEFAESCGAVDDCIKQGWSILQLATLATVGHISLAIDKAQQLPDSVFESAGGNGHSLTNTIWYFATRPETKPIDLPTTAAPEEKETKKVVDCGIPEKCTDEVLDRDAKGSTCRTRITWLMTAMGYSEDHACHKVAGGEFPSTCGPCDPGENTVVSDHTEKANAQCPPCSKEECLSDLNRCPRYETTYVCTDGQNIGGCSKTPWDIGTTACNKCCEVTACRDYENFESNEPAPETHHEERSDEIESSDCVKCDEDVCNAKINLCPIHAAPYLCIKGKNIGGCSPWPWKTGTGLCEKCCDLKLTCG